MEDGSGLRVDEAGSEYLEGSAEYAELDEGHEAVRDERCDERSGVVRDRERRVGG